MIADSLVSRAGLKGRQGRYSGQGSRPLKQGPMELRRYI